MLHRMTLIVCLIGAMTATVESADRVVVEAPELPGAFSLVPSHVPGAQNIVVIDNKCATPVEKIACRELARHVTCHN